AGVLWYLLLVGTANPQQFFSCVVGLLIVAAVALPLLVTVPFIDGLAAAIVHLVIGLPILAVTRAFAAALRGSGPWSTRPDSRLRHGLWQSRAPSTEIRGRDPGRV